MAKNTSSRIAKRITVVFDVDFPKFKDKKLNALTENEILECMHYELSGIARVSELRAADDYIYENFYDDETGKTAHNESNRALQATAIWKRGKIVKVVTIKPNTRKGK